MTEAEWQSVDNPNAMIDFVHPRVNDRKLVLFAVACCRRAIEHFVDERELAVIEAAERLASGEVTEAEFDVVMQPIVSIWSEQPNQLGDVERNTMSAARHLGGSRGAIYSASFVARAVGAAAGPPRSLERDRAFQFEQAAQCDLLRDIVGAPFVPFVFSSNWLTTVGRPAVEFAQNLDRDKCFDRVPELAEQLERAGCQGERVLGHCRGKTPHVYGCWVVDALLAREPAVRMGLVTRADWFSCGQPKPLLRYLKDKGDDAMWRRFAVACCRRIDHLMPDAKSRHAVDTAARYADGQATLNDLNEAQRLAEETRKAEARASYEAEADANFSLTPEYARVSVRLFAAAAACGTVEQTARLPNEEPVLLPTTISHISSASAVYMNVIAHSNCRQAQPGFAVARKAALAAQESEHRVQCDILRDIFRSFFGPPGEEGAWLPCGFDVRSGVSAEQWCLLPTAQRTRRGEAIEESEQ